MVLVQHAGGLRRWGAVVAAAGLAVGLTVAGSGSAGATAPPAATSSSAAASAPLVSAGGTYVALTPSRILDTRTGLGGHGVVGANQSVDLQVTGRGGVPASGVASVVVQVTSTATTAHGYVTVYPSLTTRPGVSDLDFSSGVTTSNLVTVRVGSNGRIRLFNGSAGSTQLLTDVQGYFRSGAATAAGAFTSVTPSRILDTRTNTGATGKVSPGGTVTLQVTGRGGVPASGVGAVAINVTVASPTTLGYVTIYPAGVAKPVVSNLNFLAGQVVPNLVVVPIGAGGKIALFNGSTGSTHLVADVQGYFLAGAPSATGGFKALTPKRILDTRSGLGGSNRAAPFAETKVHIEGFGGVPASGVSAVVLNVTGVNATTAGSLVAYPTGVVKPLASNLNFVVGTAQANLVIVPVDAFGWISLTNNSNGHIHEIADVAGYFLGSGVTPNVLGPYSYGPFTMGMTVAQAKVVYPALNPTYFSPTACGEANLPQANLIFNHGNNQLSFVTPTSAVQTANGIHYGDTLGSVVSRFPWADITPDDPPMVMAVTKADLDQPDPTSYWFAASGPRDPVTDLPSRSDKVTVISLERHELCFD